MQIAKNLFQSLNIWPIELNFGLKYSIKLIFWLIFSNCHCSFSVSRDFFTSNQYWKTVSPNNSRFGEFWTTYIQYSRVWISRFTWGTLWMHSSVYRIHFLPSNLWYMYYSRSICFSRDRRAFEISVCSSSALPSLIISLNNFRNRYLLGSHPTHNLPTQTNGARINKNLKQ